MSEGTEAVDGGERGAVRGVETVAEEDEDAAAAAETQEDEEGAEEDDNTGELGNDVILMTSI